MRDLDLNAEIDKLSVTVDLSKLESVTAFKKTAKGYVDQICDVFSGKNIKVNTKSPEFIRKVDAEIAKRKRFNDRNAEYDKNNAKQAKRVCLPPLEMIRGIQWRPYCVVHRRSCNRKF